jgi:hypothetical protein
MDFVSTAVVVGVVAVLMLLGIGIVINQLMRLKKFLKQAPPGQAPGEDGREPSKPPS